MGKKEAEKVSWCAGGGGRVGGLAEEKAQGQGLWAR